MRYVVSASQMKQADRNTTTQYGIPAIVLMERAALETVRIMTERFAKDAGVLVVCGRGNNGGDGLAIARLLHTAGYRVDVFQEESDRYSELCLLQRNIAQAHGLAVHNIFPDREYDIIVDALFGIGLSRNLDETQLELIRRMNALTGYHIAVDIASGLNADTGGLMPEAFRADLTVTYGYLKRGLLTGCGREYSGRIRVCEIGIPDGALEDTPLVKAFDAEDLIMPERGVNDNKGTRGKLVVIAGSEEMPGTPILVGNAAYRVGAGMVKVITQERVVNNVVCTLPELLAYGVKDTTTDEELLRAIQWGDCVVIGPGIGTGDYGKRLLRIVLSRTMLPVVLDADALTLLARDGEIGDLFARCDAERFILTPHMKECERISGMDLQRMREQPYETLQELGRRTDLVIVRKDSRTMIWDGSGEIVIPMTGNDCLAKAGSGDVLCGMIGGILAAELRRTTQIRTACVRAAVNGTLLHGMLADRAVAAGRGPNTVMPGELWKYL